MSKSLGILAFSAALLATPVAAQSGLGGEVFRSSGWATIGWDNSIAQGSYGYDLSLGAGFDLGDFDVEAGVRLTGLGLLNGAILVPAEFKPYLSVRGQYGGVHIGGVRHATDEYLPRFNLNTSPFTNTFGFGGTFPFKPFLRFNDEVAVIPGAQTLRIDGEFGAFTVSASYQTVMNAKSLYASYDFDAAKVFAGVDIIGGASIASYVGAEADFDQFGAAAMLTMLPGGGPTYFALSGVYHFNDQLDLGAVVKGTTGVTILGVTADYQVTDLLKVSAGYSSFAGVGTASASITMDLH